MSIDAFVARWAASGAAERANKDSFLNDLCDALGVERPSVTTGDPKRDTYVFEKDAVIVHEGGKRTVGRIDLFKHGCFILEAKQGADAGSKKTGTAKRNTPGWNVAMADAFGQALGYARTMDAPPPFVVVTDLGFCFDLYASFDGSGQYRPFPNAQQHRIHLGELITHEGHRDTLRAVFTDPMSLDPSRRAARVTREVAAHLAELARELEAAGHDAEQVARFLMRCIFTMFAEDVGLLPDNLFTRVLETQWIADPKRFPREVMHLWGTMDKGGHFGFEGVLRKFNGGLFRNVAALPLSREHLERLLEASKCGWADVEPAIFGTLVERALDPRERHRLGAHYTPRAYVERLVRPTIEEPLREEWDVVRAEVRRLVGEDLAALPGRKSRKLEEARATVRKFHQRLCDVRVLDPACGSGNFLYVTLDVFKRLESEVLALLAQLGDKTLMLAADQVMVTPAQFLGIEKKRWAKEIAELVLWIGFLQWHARTRRNADGSVMWLEPVLKDLHNIECRDAVLVWDEERPVRDGQGKAVTRWDGVTTKKHPVTGEDVPDDTARVPVTELVNPRRAEWPKADFIVGNPPFLGNKRMRTVLGDTYAEALRRAWDDVPETADLVMYWWNAAAELVRAKRVQRFGFITTNSATQTFAQRIVGRHLDASDGASITFAIPDHPWVDATDGASVRIAMSVVRPGTHEGRLLSVTQEQELATDEMAVVLRERRGRVNADFSIGLNLARAGRLHSNDGLGYRGITLVGDGFLLESDDALGKARCVRFLVGARTLLANTSPRRVIDLFGLTEADARTTFPKHYQHLRDTVRPLRLQQKRRAYADQWWIFAEPRGGFRTGVHGLHHYIATVETSRHRWFTSVPADHLPEQTIIAICIADASALGVLSSRAHVVWANAAGGRLGVGNDLRYTIARCFDPFPFPDATDAHRARIRTVAESLDAFRKARQAEHPTLTMTGMYNVLAKLRAGETLTDKEKVIHTQGLVSVLMQIHDELDVAVFDAYGWPSTLTDEEILERVVKLNAERAAEERDGRVRWLRPEFQNPRGASAGTQTAIADGDGEGDADDTATVAVELAPWPKKSGEQFAAVRAVLQTSPEAWGVERVARRFKGAVREQVAEALEGLASLGLAVEWNGAEGACWQAVQKAVG